MCHEHVKNGNDHACRQVLVADAKNQNTLNNFYLTLFNDDVWSVCSIYHKQSIVDISHQIFLMVLM